MISQVVGTVVHLLLCIEFVENQDMGLYGLGLATTLSYFIKIIILLVHMYTIEALQDAFFLPDRSSFQEWKPYLRVSVPATIMLCSEIWAVQILGIFAGWISVND